MDRVAALLAALCFSMATCAARARDAGPDAKPASPDAGPAAPDAGRAIDRGPDRAPAPDTRRAPPPIPKADLEVIRNLELLQNLELLKAMDLLMETPARKKKKK